jgi:hypothetical protein
MEEEKTSVKMIGAERIDHQRSRRSPAKKVSRARGWWEEGEPSYDIK